MKSHTILLISCTRPAWIIRGRVNFGMHIDSTQGSLTLVAKGLYIFAGLLLRALQGLRHNDLSQRLKSKWEELAY